MVEVSVTSPPSADAAPRRKSRRPRRVQGDRRTPGPGDLRPGRGLAVQAGRGGVGPGGADPAPVPGAGDPGRGLRGRLGSGRPPGRAAALHHRPDRRPGGPRPGRPPPGGRRPAPGGAAPDAGGRPAPWPGPTSPWTSTWWPSPATCPTRTRPWPCARSSCGPGRWSSPARARARPPTTRRRPAPAPRGTHAMSKTEDRLDGRPRRQTPTAPARTGGRRRTPRTAAPAAAGGLRPDGGHEPLRRAQGHRRPGPLQVVDQAGRRPSSWRTRCSSSARSSSRSSA